MDIHYGKCVSPGHEVREGVSNRMLWQPAKYAVAVSFVFLLMDLLFGCSRPTPEPATVAQAFYAQHREFFLLEDLPRHQVVLTPRFYAVLKQAAADAEYRIELDPWTDGQEGWIKGEPEFTTIQNDGRTATVRMDYDFELNGIERKNATLALEWDGAARRWRVADLVGPDRCSFVDLHETWFRWRAAGEPGEFFEYGGQMEPLEPTSNASSAGTPSRMEPDGDR